MPSSSSSKSRWSQAFDQLRSDQPDLHTKFLELLGSRHGNLEQGLDEILRANIQKVADRQWRIKWGTRKIIVRDVIDRAMKAFQTMKELGTALVGLDPVHIGLPWAGVCMLLATLAKFPAQEEAARSGVDKIAEIVTRYAVIEAVCTNIEAGDTSGSYNKALVNLYAKILEYQVTTACYFGKHTITRLGSSIVKFKTFQSLLEEVVEDERACWSMIQVLDMRYRRNKENSIDDRLKILLKEKPNFRDILMWLSPIQYGSDHDFVRNKLGTRYHDSGSWLLQGKAFKDWQTWDVSSKPVFWFKGHVGTGKSSMVSMVIQNRLADLGPSHEERLAYFYCSGKTQQPQGPLDVLRCLVSQLAWSSDGQTLAHSINELFEKDKSNAGVGKPDMECCIELLKVLTKDCPKVTIILDALDECSDWWTLIDSLKWILRKNGNIKLFLTSRMHVEIDDLIHDCVIVGPAANVDDVQTFIKTEVLKRDRRLLNGRYPETEARLIKVLSRRCESM